MLEETASGKIWNGINLDLGRNDHKELTNTVRPRGTRPRGTRTSLVHDFKKGSKIFEVSDFGTSRYTILKTAQNFL